MLQGSPTIAALAGCQPAGASKKYSAMLNCSGISAGRNGSEEVAIISDSLRLVLLGRLLGYLDFRSLRKFSLLRCLPSTPRDVRSHISRASQCIHASAGQ